MLLADWVMSNQGSLMHMGNERSHGKPSVVQIAKKLKLDMTERCQDT